MNTATNKVIEMKATAAGAYAAATEVTGKFAATTGKYAGKAWAFITKYSAKVKDALVAGAKAVGTYIKDHAVEIGVAGVSAVAAGFMTHSMGAASLVGAGVAAAVMIAIDIIIAKRKKQSLDFKAMVARALGAAQWAALMPWLLVYGFFGTTWLLDELFEGSLYAFAYSAVLFVA